MKYIVVLFFVASAMAVELPDPLGAGREKCKQQFGFTDEHLLRGAQYMEEFGEYLLCFATEIQHLTNVRLGLPERERVAAGLYHTLPKAVADATVDCCLAEATHSNASTPAARIVVFGKCLKDKMPVEAYNLMGVWKKPLYPYLDSCKA